MNALGFQAQVELLKNWAPDVLGQGENARHEDLYEVIRLRTQLEALSDPALFLVLLRIDKACEKDCATLLYLPKEQAERAAAAAGGNLNPLSWYGVHAWDLSLEVLEHWAWQINDAVTNPLKDAHQAEVLRAFLEMEKFHGREYINTFFIDERGSWRKWIDSDDRTELARYICSYRNIPFP